MRSITEVASEEDLSVDEMNAKTIPAKVNQKRTNLQTEFERLIANSRSYLSGMAYKFAEVATNIMSTSKGRNKLCSLIQYQAKLIYTCTINSNIADVKNMVMYI